MFKIAPRYRAPLVIAIALHVCLIIFLFIRLPAAHYRMPGPVSKTEVVQSVAVDSQQVQAQINKIHKAAAQKKAREQARIRKLEARAKAARHARLREQKRIAQLKAQKLKETARIKAMKQKRAKMLKDQENELQKKLLSQQMKNEEHQLSRTAASQQLGVVNRYKAGILRAIGSQWVIPSGANKNSSSVYLIQLAPGGIVLTVKLLRSSGNAALDRSARVAIFKASPLPVPKDPALFDNFRELRLTVSPKTVVKEDNEIS